jgi:hypothetical protein
MRIRLDDQTLHAPLLSFLRQEGCIAYYDHAKAGVEAILPHSFGADEAEAIGELVRRWGIDWPDVKVQISD